MGGGVSMQQVLHAAAPGFVLVRALRQVRPDGTRSSSSSLTAEALMAHTQVTQAITSTASDARVAEIGEE